MKLKMLNAAVGVALSVLAGVASAAEPAKTGDIGSANGKTVHCSVTTTRLYLDKTSSLSEIDLGDIPMKRGPLNGFATEHMILDIGANERIDLFVEGGPDGSIIDNGPMMTMDATLFRVDAEGRQIVLASDISSSEDTNLAMADYVKKANKVYPSAQVRLNNVDLITARWNHKNITTGVYGLLKAGLIPNGTLVGATVTCTMSFKE